MPELIVDGTRYRVVSRRPNGPYSEVFELEALTASEGERLRKTRAQLAAERGSLCRSYARLIAQPSRPEQ